MAGIVARSRERPGRVASVDGKATRASAIHVLNDFVHDVEQMVWAAPVHGNANEITVFKAALKQLLEHCPFLELVVDNAIFSGMPL